MNPKARAEIKALMEVGKELTANSTDADPAALFMSGLLTGLAMAVHIDDGSTAEQQLEELDTRLAASVGRAYLAGKMSAAKPKGTSA